MTKCSEIELRKSSAESDDVWKSAANSINGMDRLRFVDLLNGLWAGAGRVKTPDDTTIKVWYACLSDLTQEQLAKGIVRYLTERSSEFLNVQLIRELSGGQEAKSAAPMKAWDSVVAAIKHYGAYQTPRFRDDLIPVVIRHLGGWIKICDTDSEELHKWTRQHFEKTYTSLSGTKPEAAKLTNLIETENARTGMIGAQMDVQRLIESEQTSRRYPRLISE